MCFRWTGVTLTDSGHLTRLIEETFFIHLFTFWNFCIYICINWLVLYLLQTLYFTFFQILSHFFIYAFFRCFIVHVEMFFFSDYVFHFQINFSWMFVCLFIHSFIQISGIVFHILKLGCWLLFYFFLFLFEFMHLLRFIYLFHTLHLTPLDHLLVESKFVLRFLDECLSVVKC